MTQQVLLAAQVAILVLLYVFVWRVFRGVYRDLRTVATQESMILPGAAIAASAPRLRLTVSSSPTLRAGQSFAVDLELSIGRAADNDITVDDQFTSSHHARVHARGRVTDLGSTNGTFVNGSRVRDSAPLRAGDTLQVGETVFGIGSDS